MAAWALLPATSNGARRRSNETDSLNRSINSAGPAVKRPPQVAWDFLAMTRDEQTPPPGGAQREKDRRTSTRPWPKAAHFRFARDASNRTVGQMVPRWMPLF